jgi:Na+-driven multidrug efflux pump
MFVVLLITLYTSRVLIKTLGFTDYGLYQLIAGIVVLFNFLRQALTNSSFRYIAFAIGENNTQEARRIFVSAINCYAILAFAVFLLLECIGVWFINNKLNIEPESISDANFLFQASILTFCLGVITAPLTSSILAHERMDYYAFVGIIEVVLKLAAVFALDLFQVHKVVVYGLLLVAVSLFVFGISAVYCYRRFPEERYYWYWDRSRIRKLLSYSSWSVVVNGAEMGSQQAINVFFNLFIGVVGNAAIGITNQVLSGVNQFVSNLCQAFNPRIIKSYAAGQVDYFFKLIYTASKISFILYILIAIPIILNTEFILSIWLGNYPENTAVYIRIILLSLAFDSFQMPLWLAVHATGKLSVHQSVVGGIRLLSIVLIYYVFKFTGRGEYALAVSAMTTALCAVFRTVYLHYLVGLNLKEYLVKVLLRIVSLTLIVTPLSLVASLLPSERLTSFFVSLLLSTVITIFFSFVFVFTREEKRYLKEIPFVGKWFKC